MKDLFTAASIGTDAAGSPRVELQQAIGIVVVAAALSPAIVTAGYVLAGAPFGYTPMVFGGLLFVIAIDAAGIAMMFLVRARSRVRVGVDRARALLVIDSHTGRREIPIREADRFEFGSVPSSKNPAVPLHRLEIVLRSEQRVPATDAHFAVGPADRSRVVEALNREIKARGAMLS